MEGIDPWEPATLETMIHVYGTSHVSRESLEVIDEAFERHDPDIVALELDLLRLNALLSDESPRGGPLLMRLLKKFQDFVGSRTGLMPGREMLYAYNRAVKEGKEVVLIDQDIRVTTQKLNSLPRKEKFKAALSVVGGLLLPGSINLASIPEEENIQQMLEELKIHFPGFYRVLMEERNEAMISALEHLEEENPESEIVVFVGAAHRKPLEDAL